MWKVWRHQKIINNSPTLDSYGKPLPPPPTGYYWERLQDGSWELKQYENEKVCEDIVVLDNPVILEHVIMPEDTLQGICLKYRVSAVTLRQHNNFSGNAFRSKKALRIPLEAGMPFAYQTPTNEVKIQQFRNITNEGREEAMFYLEEHHYDIMEAVAALSGDTEWLLEHEQKMAPPSAPPIEEAVANGVEMVVKPTAIAYSAEEMAIHADNPEEEVRIPLLG